LPEALRRRPEFVEGPVEGLVEGGLSRGVCRRVLRRCQPENADVTSTSSYTAPDQLLQGRPDPKFGGFAYYAPALYAGWWGMNSYIYLQNLGSD